jgi:cell division protein FtsL
MTRVNVVLLVVLVACALSLVTSRHHARKLTTELSRADAQARAFDVEFGRLTLEQSTWAMPARVDKLAREQRLQTPAAARVVVVEMPGAPR